MGGCARFCLPTVLGRCGHVMTNLDQIDLRRLLWYQQLILPGAISARGNRLVFCCHHGHREGNRKLGSFSERAQHTVIPVHPLAEGG